MIRCGLVCLVLLGTLCLKPPAFGQEANKPTGDTTPNAATEAGDSASAEPDYPLDAPVITITGLCAPTTLAEVVVDGCKTVVSRAAFETALDILMPKATPEGRRFMAPRFSNSLLQSGRAFEMGLEKNDYFASRMQVSRMAAGRTAIQQKFDEEEWAKVTDREIQDYYRSHPSEFVRVDVDRLFVPKMPKNPIADVNSEEEKKRQEPWFEELGRVADKLRVRAVAGEDFLKLQSEADKYAGLQETDVDPSAIQLDDIRGKMFTEGQRPVMNVKTGDLSPVLSDQNGYSIFRVRARHTIPLDLVKDEIRHTIRDQRVAHDWEVLKSHAVVTYNDDYFGPETDEDNGSSESSNGGPGSTP